jgi:hypothetical protein
MKQMVRLMHNLISGASGACPEGYVSAVYFPSFLWVRCEGRQGLLIDYSSFKRH